MGAGGAIPLGARRRFAPRGAAVIEEHTCRRCGAPIPRHAPRGACPACLLGDAMGAGDPGPAQASSSLSVPSYGNGETTAVDRTDAGSLRSAGSNTLTILSRAYGEMPRVLLRDPAGSPETPVPAPPSAGEAPPATLTGRYHLYGEIARGGMGAVLKGHDAELNRDLAVKVLL